MNCRIKIIVFYFFYFLGKVKFLFSNMSNIIKFTNYIFIYSCNSVDDSRIYASP